jgi:hypothetical protein
MTIEAFTTLCYDRNAEDARSDITVLDTENMASSSLWRFNSKPVRSFTGMGTSYKYPNATIAGGRDPILH